MVLRLNKYTELKNCSLSNQSPKEHSPTENSKKILQGTNRTGTWNAHRRIGDQSQEKRGECSPTVYSTSAASTQLESCGCGWFSQLCAGTVRPTPTVHTPTPYTLYSTPYAYPNTPIIHRPLIVILQRYQGVPACLPYIDVLPFHSFAFSSQNSTQPYSRIAVQLRVEQSRLFRYFITSLPSIEYWPL